MIEFGLLRAKNVGPFEELELDLRQRGLLFIRGDNQDTTAASSNGAGKSHIMKAITWCLHGETPDGDKVDKLTRNGADFIEVALEWTDESGQWRVTRSKARNSSVRLMLEHNDQDVSAPTIVGTQAEIVRALGMDFATWRNTVLYAQGDVVRFADPATTDAERKLILKRIMRLDVLDKANDVAKQRLRDIERELSRLNGEAATVLAELQGLDASANIQEQLDTAAKELKDCERRSTKLEKLRDLESEIQDAINEIRERLSDAATAGQEAYTAGLAASGANATSRAASNDVRRITDELDQFKSGSCPTCGTKANSPSVKAKAAQLRKQLADAEQRIADATAEVQTQNEVAAEAKRRQAEIKAEVDEESASWYAKLTDIRRDIALAEQALVQAQTVRRRMQTLKAQLKTVDERRQVLQARGTEIATESDRLNGDKRHLEFWQRGFSNAGLPSYMMDNVMPELSQRANHYLEILADGDISINFDTQSKLKSGEAREKLSIHWDIEGEKDSTPSGGQRKKISIAVDLALMDLVAARERAAVDLLLMDEMLDGLDTTGRDRVMTLLAELRQKRSTILVISHDNAIAELFEQSLVVTKSGRKATLMEDS